MKTDFSIQRINLLLRKDWIENKKKYALGIACGGYILIIASIIGIVYLCINILNIQPGMNSFCYESSPFYTAVYWLSFAFTPAFLIATLVVLYVAYLKLKEKELR